MKAILIVICWTLGSIQAHTLVYFLFEGKIVLTMNYSVTP